MTRRVPSEPGSREPSPAVSAASGFDPSRKPRSDRWPWDQRPEPGRTNDDPMCINMDCLSSFSCRRFSQDPYQGEEGPTIFIDPRPTLLDGLLCDHFDPDCPHPTRDRDASLAEDAKRLSGEAVAARAEGIAQPQRDQL